MNIIYPTWKVPSHIHAFSTTRNTPLQDLNLPSDPIWFTQVHGNQILNLDDLPSPPSKYDVKLIIKMLNNLDGLPLSPLEFDASFTTKVNRICVVKTADCLPVLLCDEEGIAVAALHCGWKGIAKGIIGNAIRLMQTKTKAPIIAWMGPAIGPKAFEVGEDMRAQFDNKKAFECIPNTNKYFANIYTLAQTELIKYGILEKNIYQTPLCTYSNPEQFYSFRRGDIYQRMVSLIYKD